MFGMKNTLISLLATTPFAWNSAHAWMQPQPIFSSKIDHNSMLGNRKAVIVPITAHTTRRQWFKDSTAAATATAAAVGVMASATCQPVYAAQVLTEERTKSTSATCDPSVSVWKNPSNGRKIYLLGTAHISDSSAQLAGMLVADVRPDAVFVELDAKRINRVASTTRSESSTNNSKMAGGIEGGFPINGQPNSIEDGPGSSPDEPTISPVKRINPFDLKRRVLVAGSAAVGSAIQGMYKNLNKSGFSAGEEFVIAIQEGQKVGAKIILGDRDVELTLQRLTQALSKTDFSTFIQPNSEMEKTMASIMPSQQLPSSNDAKFKEEMTAYVETMKTKENVKLLMSQLRLTAPALYEALVAERDLYMANGLDLLNAFPTIVAVMGIAHVDGVESNLRNRGWVAVPLKCPLKPK